MVHSEARTRFDDITKNRPSNSRISWKNAQMLCFPLSRENVPVELGTAISPSVRFGRLSIPRHFKKCGVLCYTLRSKICVRVSVRPSVRLSFCLSVRQRFYPWYDGMLHHIQFKLILIDFNNIAGLLVNVTLVSISTDMKIADSLYCLRFVNDLPTPKQKFSIYLHKSQDLETSNSLIWRFYEAGL